MSTQAALLPLFVQVALTFALLFWTGYLRSNLLKTGAVKPQDIALREPNWPVRVAQIGNAYDNQLEVPVLFYVLTILAWVTRHADLLFVVTAWIFVALRFVHAYIHITAPGGGARFSGWGRLFFLAFGLFFIARFLLGS